jgi:hypothetical protein
MEPMYCSYLQWHGFLGQRPLVPLLLLGPPFFPIILFWSTTLVTRMTGNSLHMQWPLTSQLHLQWHVTMSQLQMHTALQLQHLCTYVAWSIFRQFKTQYSVGSIETSGIAKHFFPKSDVIERTQYLPSTYLCHLYSVNAKIVVLDTFVLKYAKCWKLLCFTSCSTYVHT